MSTFILFPFHSRVQPPIFLYLFTCFSSSWLLNFGCNREKCVLHSVRMWDWRALYALLLLFLLKRENCCCCSRDQHTCHFQFSAAALIFLCRFCHLPLLLYCCWFWTLLLSLHFTLSLYVCFKLRWICWQKIVVTKSEEEYMSRVNGRVASMTNSQWLTDCWCWHSSSNSLLHYTPSTKYRLLNRTVSIVLFAMFVYTNKIPLLDSSNSSTTPLLHVFRCWRASLELVPFLCVSHLTGTHKLTERATFFLHTLFSLLLEFTFSFLCWSSHHYYHHHRNLFAIDCFCRCRCCCRINFAKYSRFG